MSKSGTNQKSPIAQEPEVTDLLVLKAIPEPEASQPRSAEKKSAPVHELPYRLPREALEQMFADPKTREIRKRIATLLGIEDPDILDSFLRQFISAANLGEPADGLEIDYLLSVMSAVLSNDAPAKAMLAAQFGVVHGQMMRVAHFMSSTTVNVPRLEMLGRLLNGLARTSVVQWQALTDNRSRVTVGPLSVNQGGQAIVGNVTQNQTNQPKQTPRRRNRKTGSDARYRRKPATRLRSGIRRSAKEG